MSRPRTGTVPRLPRRRPGNPAERQARHRAKLRQQSPRLRAAPTRRIAPRPTRWSAAVVALIELQEEYRTWLENLPENLESSRLADKLRAIVELDLEELQAIDRPRGFGRD